MPRCSRTVALASLAVALAVAAPGRRAGAAEPTRLEEPARAAVAPERQLEWFGMNLGGGALLFNVGDTSDYALTLERFVPQGDLLLFNLSFARWYLTALELHPVFFVGYLGGGARLGARFALTGDGRHELRVGSFVGMDGFLFHINAFHPTLALRPHLQWVRNTRLGSVGVGIDLLLNFPLVERMVGDDGHSVAVPAVAYGASLYLRWTIGRRAF